LEQVHFCSFGDLANRRLYNHLFRFDGHFIDEKEVIHLIFYPISANDHFCDIAKSCFSEKQL
jgi:hypothetical protein